MTKKSGLGKGLGALIGGEDFLKQPKNVVLEIDVNKIDPNPAQARKEFDSDKLDELASSIRVHGVLQPISVKPVNERYMIISGERRWRAAKQAGFKTIPVLIKDLEDQELMEASLIENLQRTDLNPVEEATGMQYLMDTYTMTQESISERVGKSRSAVANTLRLLSLPHGVLKMLSEGKLTAGHARAVLSVGDDQEKQLYLAETIVSQGLSVRQAETLAKAPEEKPLPVLPKKVPAEFYDIENNLRERLETKVKLSGTMDKGRITLEYYTMEQLENIYLLLTKER